VPVACRESKLGREVVAGRWWREGGGGKVVVVWKNEEPVRSFDLTGSELWRRPTFARPRDALSLGLQRFTSVFGMGTGGTTAL
jgi:hypothetical protein